MQQRKSFFRRFSSWVLLSALIVGALGGAGLSVFAAPDKQFSGGNVVISEFRTSGPAGSNDEFIEIYNRTNAAVDITNWKIRKSSGCGATLADLLTIGSVSLAAGQTFLIGNSSGYTGTVDASYSSSVSDDGGIALIDGTNSTVDQVGMCSTTTYKEFDSANPLYLSPQSGTSDRSYVRKDNGCFDTDNNYSDFVSQSPSSPRTSTDTPIKCLRVTNVTSTTSNSPPPYTQGASIPITVEFSSNVNVTGAPTLLLETGLTDRTATYSSGSGSNQLTFTYTVQSGDVSDDLDYVATNALSLNGGTITGAVGDADLILPIPGTTGSLGDNKAIVIDNGADPTLVSFERQNPLTSPTNADLLTFRVTFSEPVVNVDPTDFSVTGTTTATVTTVTPINSSISDVEISGGDLASFDGVVGLDLASTQDIKDAAGKPLPNGEPPTDEIYTLDNVAPTVTVNQATGQISPVTVSATPVDFTVTFSEAISVGTFTTGDITQTGSISASLITWSIKDSGDHKKFTLSATAVATNGTLIPSISSGKVEDPAGNPNLASTSTDDTVTFSDNVRPTVIINQAAGQKDPTTALPIKFTVIFSEPIIASIFTTSDIAQTGTATGVTWSISDSGDHKTFTLTATAASDFGTLKPIIAANRVTDLVGNNNTASTSTDNVVSYEAVKPTDPLTIVISEVAWSGTRASGDDEWMELYNPSDKDIDLTGWSLSSADGSPKIDDEFDGIILKSKEYLLLERGDDDTITVLPDDYTCPSIVYQGTLNNTGEILSLKDAKGYVVDRANSNGSSWPAGSYSNYLSMQRSLISADSDYVWVSYDQSKDTEDKYAKDADGNPIRGTPCRANLPFNVTPTVTPSPTRTPIRNSSGSSGSTTAEPILVISEFLPRPGTDWNNDGQVDVFDEFIEVINGGTVNVNLSGYRLDDEENEGSAPYSLPNLTLQPGERAVFYGAQTGILLSDAGDTVRLLRGSTVEDAFTYDFARYPDQSWCRILDSYGDWTTPCFPTPNNPNALTGNIPRPSRPSTNLTTKICLMPDNAPEVFVYAECEAPGGGIWNRQFWDGTGFFKWFIPYIEQRLNDFFE